MKRKIANAFMASLVFSGVSLVLAQSTEPPPIVKIIREDMKPGKGAAHEKTESAYVRAFQKSKYPNYIAWEAMSGQTQVWFLEGYATYAGIEAAFKIANAEPLKATLDQLDVQDGELRTGERTMIARYLKDLSYFGAPLNLGKVHFVRVVVWRVRYGHEGEFSELRKIMNAAFEKAGVKSTRVAYVVAEGAPLRTYLVVTPVESLSAVDEEPRWNNREAMGEGFERYQKLNSDIVVSTEWTLFAVNPKMSNPPKAYVDADPGFWTPKPAAK
jgi:hypothetical protein